MSVAGGIAITGSKGGVGKSSLAVNVAVALARWQRRVLLVDGDLGLANLDVLLGLIPERTVEHLLEGNATLDELLLEGPRGVRVLPAASGIPRLARLEAPNRSRLLDALVEAGTTADDVLVDTGAGLHEATLTFQLAASRVIVVTTPEPTSVVDAYASLKVLWSADPTKPVDLVINEVVDEPEARRVFGQLERACGHFMGIRPGLLGWVPHDPRVEESVRHQRAVLELYPTSPASRGFERIALKLTASSRVSPDGYWARLARLDPEERPN